jgi:hypothetical protein
MRVGFAETDLGELLAWTGSRFHVWREEQRGNKPTKVPYRPSGGNAKSNDPTTWVPFDVARAALESGRYSGLAFQLGELPDGRWVVGIDLDLCRNADGLIHTWAADILKRLPTYAEVSPTGSGVKLIGLVDWLPDCLGTGGMEAGVDSPEPLTGHKPNAHKNPEIGLYPSKRFFALTGQRLECAPDELCDITEAFAQLALELRQSTPARAALAVDASDIELTRGAFSAELLQRILDHPLAGPRWRNDDRCEDRSRCDFRLAEDMTLDFTQDEVEAAVRQYPYGQIGSGKLTGYAADRQIKRLIAKAKANVPEKVDFAPLLPPHDPETGEILEEAPAPAIEPQSAVADIVAEAGGILGEMVDWMVATARYPQPLLALGAAIATCGALMGHKYRLLDGPDTRSNVMILAFAPSGAGKENPRTCAIEALFQAGLRQYCYGSGIASKQGIISDLTKSFSGVKLIDEAGHFFGGILDKNAAGFRRDIGATLTMLSTSATKVFFDDTKAADRDPDTIIYDTPHPCYCLFATTIKGAFWASMSSGSADDGSLARFILFEASDVCPDPVFDIEPIERRLDSIAAKLRELVVGPGIMPTDFAVAAALGSMKARFTGEGKNRARTFDVPDVPVVPMTNEARGLDRKLLLAEVELKREHSKTQFGAIVARRCEQTRRLALIRAVSRNPFAPTVEAHDLAWADRLVAMSQAAMMTGIANNIADTQHETMLKKMLRIIRQHGGWMTASELARKTQFFKRRDREEGIIQLEESGLVEIRAESGATKPRKLIRARENS